jgi:hypothetical protein
VVKAYLLSDAEVTADLGLLRRPVPARPPPRQTLVGDDYFDM